MTAKPYRSHEDATIESFGKDPEYAAEYLNAVLEDGDAAELLVALNRLAKTFGGVTSVAAQGNLNGTSLYRTLSKRGNPELKTLVKVLSVMHLRLAVRPMKLATEQAPSVMVSESSGGLASHRGQHGTGQFVIKKLEPKRRPKAIGKIRKYSETVGAGIGLDDERCYA